MSAKHAFYHRLAVAGAVVATSGTALYSALAIPAGDPRAPLFVPLTILIAALAVLMHRVPKALWVAAIGGPLVLLVQALDPFRLLHPDSFVDFAPSVLIVAGSAAAFVGSIVALRERHAGTERGAKPVERIVLALGAAALVGIAAVSAAITFARPTTAMLPGGKEAVIVDADEDRWDPELLSVSATEETALLLRNTNWIAHTFHSDDLGVDVYLAPNSERIVEVRAKTPGTYEFVCDVTGHEMMVGRIRIT